MDYEEFNIILFLLLKLCKKSSQNVKKERRSKPIRNFEIFEKRLDLCTFFDFCQTVKDISSLFRPVIPLGSTRMEVF